MLCTHITLSSFIHDIYLSHISHLESFHIVFESHLISYKSVPCQDVLIILQCVLWHTREYYLIGLQLAVVNTVPLQTAKASEVIMIAIGSTKV